MSNNNNEGNPGFGCLMYVIIGALFYFILIEGGPVIENVIKSPVGFIAMIIFGVWAFLSSGGGFGGWGDRSK